MFAQEGECGRPPGEGTGTHSGERKEERDIAHGDGARRMMHRQTGYTPLGQLPTTRTLHEFAERGLPPPPRTREEEELEALSAYASLPGGGRP